MKDQKQAYLSPETEVVKLVIDACIAASGDIEQTIEETISW